MNNEELLEDLKTMVLILVKYLDRDLVDSADDATLFHLLKKYTDKQD